MKSEYIFKRVRIGKFISEQNNEKYYKGHKTHTLELSIDSLDEKLCLIDIEKEIAYDINNLRNNYRILKRNIEGQLIDENIKLNVIYGLSMKDIKQEDKQNCMQFLEGFIILSKEKGIKKRKHK